MNVSQLSIFCCWYVGLIGGLTDKAADGWTDGLIIQHMFAHIGVRKERVFVREREGKNELMVRGEGVHFIQAHKVYGRHDIKYHSCT